VFLILLYARTFEIFATEKIIINQYLRTYTKTFLNPLRLKLIVMKTRYLKNLLILSGLTLFANCNKENDVPSILQNQSQQKVINTTIPKADHIVIVIEENHGYLEINESDSAPYINQVAKDSFSVKFTNSYAIEYGSQKDYLDLYSGSNQGAGGGKHPEDEPFITPNLGRQLIDAGLSYSTFSQGLPYTGYNSDTYGAYVRRHNAAANWMGTGTNQIPITTNQPFTAFPSDFTKLPTVSFVIPNLNRDMHDGTILEGDNWLRINLNKYIQWAKTHNSLFILTFDEDDLNHHDHNHIFTLFCGQKIRRGNDTIHINHYSVLRTIEDMYGLPHAGNADSVKAITNCWKH